VAGFTIPRTAPQLPLIPGSHSSLASFWVVVAIMGHPKYSPCFYVTKNCVSVTRTDQPLGKFSTLRTRNAKYSVCITQECVATSKTSFKFQLLARMEGF